MPRRVFGDLWLGGTWGEAPGSSGDGFSDADDELLVLPAPVGGGLAGGRRPCVLPLVVVNVSSDALESREPALPCRPVERAPRP